MRMVAVGGCTAMTVGGLRHGQQVLARASEEAGILGVSVEAVTHAGAAGIGIRVQRGHGTDHDR
jgi:hypothetical protein